MEETRETFEKGMGYTFTDGQWDTIMSRNPADYFPTAKDAIPEHFEPVVPCRLMETRACTDLSLDDSKRFRRNVCLEGECVRFEGGDGSLRKMGKEMDLEN